MTERWRIVSWNVNGIRAVVKKGFVRFAGEAGADVLALQETRVDPPNVPPEIGALPYDVAFTHAERLGYSGVATLSRLAPARTERALGIARFDVEGRVLVSEYAPFLLYNVYFPKGSGTLRDNSRVPYKLAFYDALFRHAKTAAKARQKPLVIVGDFNTAHQEIDLANPRSNRETSGFLPEERDAFARHLRKGGFVDSYRHLHPERVQYSWWSQRVGVRERNVGWRIDYVWLSEALVPHLADAFIWDQVKGSDHCPVGVELVFGEQDWINRRPR